MSDTKKYKRCKLCGQPMLPPNMKKQKDEYDHASGCPDEGKDSQGNLIAAPAAGTPPQDATVIKMFSEKLEAAGRYSETIIGYLEEAFAASRASRTAPQVEELNRQIAELKKRCLDFSLENHVLQERADSGAEGSEALPRENTKEWTLDRNFLSDVGDEAIPGNPSKDLIEAILLAGEKVSRKWALAASRSGGVQKEK